MCHQVEAKHEIVVEKGNENSEEPSETGEGN